MLPGLPDVERSALGVREHGHPPGLRHVEGRRHDTPTGSLDLRGRAVRALDPDVGVPYRRRRSALRLRAHGGHVAAAEARDVVLAGRVGRHHVLELPSEEIAVEGHGGLGVGLARVDPTWDAGEVSVSLEH